MSKYRSVPILRGTAAGRTQALVRAVEAHTGLDFGELAQQLLLPDDFRPSAPGQAVLPSVVVQLWLEAGRGEDEFTPEQFACVVRRAAEQYGFADPDFVDPVTVPKPLPPVPVLAPADEAKAAQAVLDRLFELRLPRDLIGRLVPYGFTTLARLHAALDDERFVRQARISDAQRALLLRAFAGTEELNGACREARRNRRKARKKQRAAAHAAAYREFCAQRGIADPFDILNR